MIYELTVEEGNVVLRADGTLVATLPDSEPNRELLRKGGKILSQRDENDTYTESLP